jgi:apolipoprotein N-acyltransferase
VLLLRMLGRDGFQVNSLLQLWLFGGLVLAPMGLAGLLRHACRALARIEGGMLVLERPGLRVEVPLDRIARLHVWRLPLPGPGLSIELASGRRLAQGIAMDDPMAFARVLASAGANAVWADPSTPRRAAAASFRASARRTRLDHPLARFILFPLLPALVAFRLHQHIAFGGTFGEWQTYGAAAWLSGLLIWWAAWSLGMMLFAGLLRVLIEAFVAATAAIAPPRAAATRHALEALGRIALYVGVPGFLALRLL